MEEKNLNINLPTSATTHSPSTELTPLSGMQVKPETTEQKVERLFLRPLRKLDEYDDGYIVLIVVLVLLEKSFRVEYDMDEKEEFHDSHEAFGDLSQLFQIERKQAIEFWRMFRNGLMHRALPKHTRTISRYELNQTGIPLSQKGDVVQVDAIAMRDVVMRHIANQGHWDNDKFARLPETHEPIPGLINVQCIAPPENPA